MSDVYTLGDVSSRPCQTFKVRSKHFVPFMIGEEYRVYPENGGACIVEYDGDGWFVNKTTGKVFKASLRAVGHINPTNRSLVSTMECALADGYHAFYSSKSATL